MRSREKFAQSWSAISFAAMAGILVFSFAGSVKAQEEIVTPACERTIKADVVAFDQVFFYNRLGAVNPAGMIYALRRDVESTSSTTTGLTPGKVRLKNYKRPRPIVLRMNVGDCLEILFQNLLDPARADDNQPATRTASIHVVGLQLKNSILDDGSNVGTNPSSLVAPGNSIIYTLYAQKEGNHILYSTAATTGGEGDGGSLPMGLFGSVNIEPRGAEWYRSQVTENDMSLATRKNPDGTPMKTPAGQPVINYDAVYPTNSTRPANTPILKILDANNNIVHSDLNAIVTGPNRGAFPSGTYRPNPVEPDRNQPFREFTVVYHDEIKAVQAFPQFDDEINGQPNPLAFTLHSVRDGFAINYGTAGIGAEILANRFGVGPMAKCTECLFEEFFLSSWAIGDPAQIVDIPANTRNSTGQLITGFKATKVFFPDDPSNVHHAYMNDNVKMRVGHAGPKEHHIHHLHAHQWLHTPESDNSTYLDSQAQGPAYSFTTEIAHGGAGNRNRTPGDSIFHCHFYPHFAQGMWELFRVHDVFEAGTKLDANGRPTSTSRKLPDGEIAAGTPIPAIVPIPTIAMPLMPTASVPGYPFFVAAQAGHRPPTPPLDVVDDGGLPRHYIIGGTAVHHKERLAQFDLNKARLDFDKSLVKAQAVFVPETGTATEVAAMDFHAVRTHASFTPEGVAANFITNGRPKVAGAPLADPCVSDTGAAAGVPRLYKSANIQLDIKLNKAAWHFGQSRISALWADVKPTLDGTRPPEPLFFRANTNDCITFYHTNLVPRVYTQDDFQVRTPTDTMGQHIHLVKFDVLASDGAANGFNYEDGTFSPEEVIERIKAIRAFNGCIGVDSGDARDGTTVCPKAKAHPFFGTLGAKTTVQRWYADNVLNNLGQDRTLRTVFTHDHFGPSTHQQTGLYAGLVVEPQNSKWRNPESGVVFGGAGVPPRFDGGPTSWRADILTATVAESYREFLLEFADFQLAYDGNRPVNPPAKDEPGLPFLLEPAEICPGSPFPPPCPEAIAAADVGTMSVNYRNEPVALRVRDPGTNTQAAGLAGNLSHVYRSNVLRADPRFNVQPNFYPPLTADVQAGDPFTPLLRAYEDDPVQIRILVGAHEEGHNFNVNGIKWKFEPSDTNSGFRNNQMMGISEHFEFIVPKLPRKPDGKTSDYLYQPGKGVDDQWHGLWGLMRVYATKKVDLLELPNNPKNNTLDWTNQGDFNGVCPKTATVRSYKVTATTAQKALPGGTLVYNPRETNGGKLHDPTAIMYFRTTDLDPLTGKLKTGVVVEPLILRASAGECVVVALTNNLPAGTQFDLDGFNTLPMIVDKFNANQIRPSADVGLHSQLVYSDVTRSDGMNVGFNPVQTVSPGQTIEYQWYAGDIVTGPNNTGVATPAEFGATNLMPADPIKHTNKAAFGALIIEPKGSFWSDSTGSRAEVNVNLSTGGFFREFVTMFQNDINLRFNGFNGEATSTLGIAVPNLAEAEDPEDSGQKAVNYRTEPLWKRIGFAPNTPLEKTREFDFTNVLSNAQVGGDPVTPVFHVLAGSALRIRMLHPGGHPRNDNYLLHGHIWESEPYIDGSTALGSNPLSNWVGSQGGVGPGTHFDFLPKNGAGGLFRVQGDYLYRTFQSFHFDGGIWGLVRVSSLQTQPPSGCTPCPPGVECTDVCTTSSGATTSDPPSPDPK
jgi:manganese oxidase